VETVIEILQKNLLKDIISHSEELRTLVELEVGKT
jgi:hypothetical protein